MKIPSLIASIATTIALGSVTLASPTAAQDAWHPVHEAWQPYPEEPLTLPADRYCGDFTVTLTPERQDVRVRVLSRWGSGAPRTEIYAGALHSRATNSTSGASTDLNLSGSARVLYRPDGTMQRYSMHGPVGMGWPTGSGEQLSQGYYRFTGHHVVEFTPDGTRTLAIDQGRETDVCNLVDGEGA